MRKYQYGEDANLARQVKHAMCDAVGVLSSSAAGELESIGRESLGVERGVEAEGDEEVSLMTDRLWPPECVSLLLLCEP